MNNSFKSILDKSKSSLILIPTTPFFDQVAAALSLYLSLKNHYKVNVISHEPMTVEYNRLIGVNKVEQKLGNKHLVISFDNYQANDIDRVSYDIENSRFKLTVIPKEGVHPPKNEHINFDYAGINADTLILVGGAHEGHFPHLSKEAFKDTQILHIGVRNLDLKDQKLISFARQASSVSEIVAGIIRESQFRIDPDISTNLIMGLEHNTENLSSGEESADTFDIMAYLLRTGGKRGRNIADQGNYPKGSIPDNAVQKAQNSSKPKEEESDKKTDQEVPQDWLNKPQVYKGTSIK